MHSAFCAIEQSGIAAAWSWFADDVFIDSLGGVGNDYVAGSYWNWFSDLSYGMTSLSAHALRPGESLLISIGRLPLRIEPVAEAVRHSTTTLHVSQFGFDANFNPVWEPAASSTVTVNGIPYEAASGTLAYVASTTDALEIHATKEGYLDAEAFRLSVVEGPRTPLETNDSTNPAPSPSPDAVSSGIAFLRANQRENGSFASPLLTDWAAIAFAGADVPNVSLKRYVQESHGTLTSATDYERRAMALAALGINPREEVAEIVSRFDGSQVGDPNLINDDIFALIALRLGGYTSADPIMQNIAATLLARQGSDGAWEGTDLTAAAMQALVPLSDLAGVPEALARARSALATRQQPDGCIGNSFATSWSIMAIRSLGESPDAWRSASGGTPRTCLMSTQAADGGFEAGAPEDMRIWATAYALPALADETWDSLLRKFRKPIVSLPKEETDAEVEFIKEAEKTPEVPSPVPELSAAPQGKLAGFPANPEPRPALKIPAHALAASALGASDMPAISEPSPKKVWERIIEFLYAMLVRLLAA